MTARQWRVWDQVTTVIIVAIWLVLMAILADVRGWL